MGTLLLLYWLALLPLGGELGKSPRTSPLISVLQTDFHVSGKSLRGRQAGPL